MSDEKKYRHELKYLISNEQLELEKHRLKGIMQRDPHAGSSGCYNIRSLYFDDYYNKCYYENENGTDPREKSESGYTIIRQKELILNASVRITEKLLKHRAC